MRMTRGTDEKVRKEGGGGILEDWGRGRAAKQKGGGRRQIG